MLTWVESTPQRELRSERPIDLHAGREPLQQVLTLLTLPLTQLSQREHEGLQVGLDTGPLLGDRPPQHRGQARVREQPLELVPSGNQAQSMFTGALNKRFVLVRSQRKYRPMICGLRGARSRPGQRPLRSDPTEATVPPPPNQLPCDPDRP